MPAGRPSCRHRMCTGPASASDARSRIVRTARSLRDDCSCIAVTSFRLRGPDGMVAATSQQNAEATRKAMRHPLRWALALSVVAMMQGAPAWAQSPKFIASHQNWTVYEVDDPKGKICYVASEPTKQD